jgi:hypothetical protein
MLHGTLKRSIIGVERYKRNNGIIDILSIIYGSKLRNSVSASAADGGDVHGVDAGLEALIRKHYDFLLNHVDSRAAALIDRLYSEELIDLRLKNELEEERNAFLRNSRILSAASTTWSSREQFDRFLSVLDQTGQGYIADVVRGTPKENSSSGGATIGASRRTGVDL